MFYNEVSNSLESSERIVADFRILYSVQRKVKNVEWIYLINTGMSRCSVCRIFEFVAVYVSQFKLISVAST